MFITTASPAAAADTLAAAWLDTDDAAAAADVWASEFVAADDDAAALLAEFDAVYATLMAA